jgi:type II secretory pathway pseudopilin PulG
MKFLRPARRSAAFTMIEIAMSLAVIGLALVTIIGILPQGMDVQKENRRETIINQDANYLLQAIRGGARGLDDLTNYVISITVYTTAYSASGNPGSTTTYTSTYTSSSYGNKYYLTTGSNIVGLLSMPKYIPLAGGGFQSNYVTANFRAISGEAVEKFPQTNTVIQEAAFSYRLVSEIVPWGATTNYADPTWTNFAALFSPAKAGQAAANAVAWAQNFSTNGNAGVFYLTNGLDFSTVSYSLFVSRANAWLTARTVQTNLYDVRLLFRWPLQPGNRVGNSRQTYRAVVSGAITNDPAGGNLWFFRPDNFNPISL